MPEHKFLQELENKNFEPWVPTLDEKKAKAEDEEMINDMLEYRSRFEGMWDRAARAWNLLAEPVSDPRVSNVLLPFIRMIGATAIQQLSLAHPRYIYKPRQRSDDAKQLLWEGASEHIDNATNMSAQEEDFYTNLIVKGTSAYEDFVHLPHMHKRYKENGEWKTKSVRDFSRPKIGTRSRSPRTFGFLAGTLNPNEQTPIFMRDWYPYNTFLQELGNVYLPNGSPKYMNCKHVAPGADAMIAKDDSIDYEPMDHNGVSIIELQDPVRDIRRLYANGVLILDMPLHEYIKTQTTTLSIATNNHIYDDNFETTAGYGAGEAHLLAGLDALYQAIGNLNIDNYKLANTNLISIRSPGGATAIDEDFDYLSGVRVEGDVIVSPMGTVRLGEFSAFKEMIDQWAKWTTKVSFDQLTAQNQSGTAFELQQQIRAANQGNEYKIRKLENGCLKKHGRTRLAFILSDMTVEEYQELDEAEIPMIQELLKKDKAPKEDYKFNNGKPVERIVRQKIKVKNRKLTEELKDGKRTIDGLYDEGPSDTDSEISVVPEYFFPVEYIESGAVPDIEVEGGLDAERDLDFQKKQFIVNYGRQRIAEAAANPDVEQLGTDFEGRKLDQMILVATKTPEESVMGTKVTDERIEQADEAIRQAEEMLSPTNPQNVQPVQVQDVNAEGFGSLGEPAPGSTNPLGQAETGALGPA